MPTENERKYVLRPDTENYFSKLAEDKLHISQGYLIASRGVSLRFRKSYSNPAKKINYCLTFKYNVAGGRVIEIEKKVEERDFNDLWPQCLNKLHKIRYLVRDMHKQLWEIDFFKDHNEQTYFAMAEFEMPEGKLKPDHIPKFITDNLVYEVALTDSRFASKLLGDVRYAVELLENLKKEKSNASRSEVS